MNDNSLLINIFLLVIVAMNLINTVASFFVFLSYRKSAETLTILYYELYLKQQTDSEFVEIIKNLDGEE